MSFCGHEFVTFCWTVANRVAVVIIIIIMVCVNPQDGEDIFSVYHRTAHAEDRAGDYSTSLRLVEILREENTSLKQELETYYQRVRKLQKVVPCVCVCTCVCVCVWGGGWRIRFGAWRAPWVIPSCVRKPISTQ